MSEICVLIAAAGKGLRAGLSYPKTLFTIQGKPILVRIAELLVPYAAKPTVIVSGDGKDCIQQCLLQNSIPARLVVQQRPRGMGDAVLCFERSPEFANAKHVILVWGDIPFIQRQTVETMVQAHTQQGNDFTFVTRLVGDAYTRVLRDDFGNVTRVIETREETSISSGPGESDIGLFIFRKSVTLDSLREELPGKLGNSTGEHGFLYIIGHLVSKGLRVVALPIATELDMVSLNSMNDVRKFL